MFVTMAWNRQPSTSSKAELFAVADGLTTHDHPQGPPFAFGAPDGDGGLSDLGTLAVLTSAGGDPYRRRVGGQRSDRRLHVGVLVSGDREHRAEMLARR